MVRSQYADESAEFNSEWTSGVAGLETQQNGKTQIESPNAWDVVAGRKANRNKSEYQQVEVEEAGPQVNESAGSAQEKSNLFFFSSTCRERERETGG